jgi:hypothetical protein
MASWRSPIELYQYFFHLASWKDCLGSDWWWNNVQDTDRSICGGFNLSVLVAVFPLTTCGSHLGFLLLPPVPQTLDMRFPCCVELLLCLILLLVAHYLTPHEVSGPHVWQLLWCPSTVWLVFVIFSSDSVWPGLMHIHVWSLHSVIYQLHIEQTQPACLLLCRGEWSLEKGREHSGGFCITLFNLRHF